MFFHNFTRGGQTSLHQLRMFAQVLKKVVYFSFITGCFVFAYGMSQVGSYSWSVLRSYCYCLIKVHTFSINSSNLSRYKQSFFDGKQWLSVPIEEFPELPFVKAQIDYLASHSFKYLLYALVSMIAITVFFIVGWSLYGRSRKKQQILKGGSIVSAKHLSRTLRYKSKASPIKLAGVPLLKDTETQHMLVTGCTGSGKSNCITELLQQLRHQKTIVIDINGSYVSKFYREGYDILMNPFDTRGVPWNPWAELSKSYHMKELAGALVKTENRRDPFWSEAAQSVLVATLQKFKDTNRCSLSEAMYYS